MNWIITEDITSTNNLRINFNPENYALTLFFANLKTVDFSDYILQTISSTGGFGVQNTSILFYNQMDLEDKEGLNITEGDIYIYTYDGVANETILKETDFDKIIYDFALEIIAINYKNYALPKNWIEKMNDSVEKLKSRISNNEIQHIDNINNIYTFFDGIKFHPFNRKYDDWLSSSDYSVWSNSFVEIQNKRIYLIKENVKVLSTFKNYNKEELELIAFEHNFKIKEKNGFYYAFTNDHNIGQFQISENDQLGVIYCIEGGNAPESIFIYKVFEK
jgi:hypothetical protein